MTEPIDPAVAEDRQWWAELERVCPESVSGLAIQGSPPPNLSKHHRIAILQTLPENAGAEAFIAAWFAFARENPEAILP